MRVEQWIPKSLLILVAVLPAIGLNSCATSFLDQSAYNATGLSQMGNPSGYTYWNADTSSNGTQAINNWLFTLRAMR